MIAIRITRRTLVAVTIAAAALAGCGEGGRPNQGPSAAVREGADVLATTADTAVSPTYEPPSTAPTGPAPTAPDTTESTTTASTTESTNAAPTTTATSEPGAVDGEPVAWRGVSLVEDLAVLDAPAGDVVASLPATTAFGTPTVVGVLDRVPGWVQVQVPVRPNDLTGWVSADDVRLEPVDTEIHVDLERRTLRFSEHGEVVGEWPVAIGRPDRPTPTGLFFVTDKLATGDPDSVWGDHAVGVSAFQPDLTEFIGGIGQIGVHGTNDPSSIGNAASSGCVRLPNDVINELIDRIPLGTPVHIE